MVLSNNVKTMVYSSDWGYKYSKKYYNKKKKDNFVNFNKNKYSIKDGNILCGCIVLNDTCTKILLVKNKYLWDKHKIEKWSCPKGHYESSDKNYLQSALRETYEETGIKLYFKSKKPLMIRINLTYYFPICIPEYTIDNQMVLNNKEIDEIKWVSWESLKIQSSNRDLKVIVNRFKHRIVNMAIVQNK